MSHFLFPSQKSLQSLIVVLTGWLLFGGVVTPQNACGAWRLASFSVDVTIPLGHRCMGVLPTKSQKVADRLYAHGFVLLGPEKPIVQCAVDWCEIRNAAYDDWREALAQAAQTSRERVLVSSLHQHDAPVTDRDAAQLLNEVGLQNELYDEAFHVATIKRVAQALKDALANAQPVTHIGLGEAEVREIASNRRVVKDGQVTFHRGSRSGANDFYREAPVGLIDPMLKTISFWNGEKPLLALHSYATHPMSYYGRGEVSADFVGLARARRQRDDFSVKQIYVSGCSGDVTAGKFNDGSPDSRVALTERLYQAMVAAWKATKRVPLQTVTFRHAELQLPYYSHDVVSQKRLAARLADPKVSTEQRILAAMGLASRQRVAAGQPIDLCCLDLGSAQIVLFPGESFIGYQLMAQQMRPDSFVMSIGYGECWPGYIPTQSAFQDNFHDSWLWVDRGSEARIRTALKSILASK
ncbi:MAG TPA: hypothetical protein DCY79_25655 [Planctomycetaceae bacterium]|nr:hypothetical protein [Blastopirellula sp.]HAY83207.1 hypothetical protein [Planctomycetaceae bacterium]